jgi:hypothetical protein
LLFSIALLHTDIVSWYSLPRVHQPKNLGCRPTHSWLWVWTWQLTQDD